MRPAPAASFVLGARAVGGRQQRPGRPARGAVNFSVAIADHEPPQCHRFFRRRRRQPDRCGDGPLGAASSGHDQPGQQRGDDKNARRGVRRAFLLIPDGADRCQYRCQYRHYYRTAFSASSRLLVLRLTLGLALDALLAGDHGGRHCLCLDFGAGLRNASHGLLLTLALGLALDALLTGNDARRRISLDFGAGLLVTGDRPVLGQALGLTLHALLSGHRRLVAGSLNVRSAKKGCCRDRENAEGGMLHADVL